jgi:hypothetical protein
LNQAVSKFECNIEQYAAQVNELTIRKQKVFHHPDTPHLNVHVAMDSVDML